MRVLLVEDNGALAHAIELMLKADGFNVYHTTSGEDAVDLARLYEHDIVLLDLSLPDISGFEVLRSLSALRVRSPILVVSGHTSMDDKIKALRCGADDYITKPFHREELVARVYALVRRSKGHADPVIQIDDLLINLQTKTVQVNGNHVYLTAKEYKVLELLSLRVGKTVTKEMLLNHIYGGLDEPGAKIMDVFICKLRRKLEQASQGKKYIGTHWGRGYVLRDPSEVARPVFA